MGAVVGIWIESLISIFSNVLDILKLDEYAFLDGLDEKFTFSVV